jgi:hypothetical protein
MEGRRLGSVLRANSCHNSSLALPGTLPRAIANEVLPLNGAVKNISPTKIPANKARQIIERPGSITTNGGPAI